MNKVLTNLTIGGVELPMQILPNVWLFFWYYGGMLLLNL